METPLDPETLELIEDYMTEWCDSSKLLRFRKLRPALFPQTKDQENIQNAH